MKKALALLFALMLLCLPMAFAEEAQNTSAIAVLSNINAMGQSLGDDFSLWLGVDGANEPIYVIECQSGEEVLLSAVARINGNRLEVMLQGDDTTYVEDIPQSAGSVDMTQFNEMLRSAIPELDSLVLPPIPGVPIPKVDATTLLSSFITGNQGSAQTFAISTDAIDSLLDMVQMYAGLAGSNVPGLDQVLQYIPMLKGQLSLQGTIADEGDAQVTRCDLIAQGEAQGTLVFTTRENSFSVSLEGGGSQVASLDVTSSPADSRFDIAVNAMGMNVANINVYQDGGLQKFDFGVSASGEAIRLTFAYGTADARDLVTFDMEGGTAGNVNIAFDTAMEEGVRTGTFNFDSTMNYRNTSLSADLTMFLGQLDVADIEWSTNTASLDDMGNSPALQAMQEYVNTLNGAA